MLQHRPRVLADLHYHQELSMRLTSLVRYISIHLRISLSKATFALFKKAGSGDFPHLLFYGPSGAGKKTRISATLRELFGPGVEKVGFH